MSKDIGFNEAAKIRNLLWMRDSKGVKVIGYSR